WRYSGFVREADLRRWRRLDGLEQLPQRDDDPAQKESYFACTPCFKVTDCDLRRGIRSMSALEMRSAKSVTILLRGRANTLTAPARSPRPLTRAASAWEEMVRS